MYNLAQRLAGKPNLYPVFVREHLRPVPGARILDIGCGTGELLKYLPAVSYLGVDINDDYIASARGQYPGRGEFVHADLRHVALRGDPFDVVVAVGVVHHLDDEAAAALVALARRALAAGGRFVLLEPCRLAGQPLIAKVVIAMDRGEHVRDRAGYEHLLRLHFGDVSGATRADLLLVASTHVVFECRAGATAA
ncbi:MAG: class I SAM-dependent methyltransferase [Vicinamibacterales bacterium]